MRSDDRFAKGQGWRQRRPSAVVAIARSVAGLRPAVAAHGRLRLLSFTPGSGRAGMQAAQFIHGNRLEALADRLIDALSLTGAEDPLQPDIVVVAHPALGRWLQERMAMRSGIAINVQFPLPSTFAWNVLRDFAGTARKLI
jgi:hypothetical protein